jgi:hypothetical protein
MSAKTQVFQIYTYGKRKGESENSPLLSWDLHAQVECRESCLLHAKMLALNPQFEKIQVEQLIYCENTGAKKSRTIKIFERKAALPKWAAIKSVFAGLRRAS